MRNQMTDYAAFLAVLFVAALVVPLCAGTITDDHEPIGQITDDPEVVDYVHVLTFGFDHEPTVKFPNIADWPEADLFASGLICHPFHREVVTVRSYDNGDRVTRRWPAPDSDSPAAFINLLGTCDSNTDCGNRHAELNTCRDHGGIKTGTARVSIRLDGSKLCSVECNNGQAEAFIECRAPISEPR